MRRLPPAPPGAPSSTGAPPSELAQLHALGDARARGGAPAFTSPRRLAQGEHVVVPRARAGSSASAGGGGAGGGGAPLFSRAPATASFPRAAPASAGSAALPLARSAANSHVANDAYMGDFEEAYRALYGDDAAPAASLAPALALARFSSRRDVGTLLAAGGRLPPPPPRGGAGAPPAAAAAPSRAWAAGPADAAGALVDLSDRPLLVAALDPRASGARAEVLVGGADHAVYGVDALRGAVTRRLYGGRAGHTEWVTAVTFLGDGSGRAASAGMDGRVCVWGVGGSPRAPPPCAALEGHFGSVSALAAPGGGTAAGGRASARAGHLLVSAGYDKSVRLWDARRAPGAAPAADLRGHGAPVLLLALRADDAAGAFAVASGDRGGAVRLWDAAAGAPAAELAGHRGHVTALAWCGALLLSGAQDGCVRAWDPRAAAPAAVIPAHAAAGGSGAVGDIAVCGTAAEEEEAGGAGGGGGAAAAAAAAGEGGGDGGDSPTTAGPREAAPLVVTAGADKRLCVLDPRGGWRERATLGGHRDFIYSLAVVGGVALSGAGDGLLLAHDVASGRALWGLGANAAAVRCVVPFVPQAGRQALVAAGDDGKAIVYAM